MLKDYQKRKMDIEERIRLNMLDKQTKAQEKERDALKRTRTIIAELQECEVNGLSPTLRKNIINLKMPTASEML